MTRSILILLALSTLYYISSPSKSIKSSSKDLSGPRVVKECKVVYYPKRDYTQDMCKSARIELY